MQVSRVFDCEVTSEGFGCIGWEGAFHIGLYSVDDLAF
jgi:hypothetical protein